jgi:hypothetical protein
MYMDAVAKAILTGTAPDNDHPALYQAIADRFKIIVSGLTQKTGDFIYDGNRCAPENLGWRFVQNFGITVPRHVTNGVWDTEIEKTWHEAADAEYWYAHEKDWGD